MATSQWVQHVSTHSNNTFVDCYHCHPFPRNPTSEGLAEPTSIDGLKFHSLLFTAMTFPSTGVEPQLYGHFDGVTDDTPQTERVVAMHVTLLCTEHPLVWLIDIRNSLTMKTEFSCYWPLLISGSSFGYLYIGLAI